jgi:hypothetical protein
LSHLVTLTLVFDLLNKNFNLSYIYEDFDISHEYSLWQDLSMGTTNFDFVTLTLVFDLLIENFNLAVSFDW